MKTNRRKSGPVPPLSVSPAGRREAFSAAADPAFERKLDKAVASLENRYLASASLSIEEISEKVLQAAKRLTGSAFGFAGYVDPATAWFSAATLTRGIWDKCGIPGKSAVFKDFTGLWGWVLKNKRPLLTNNPSADRRSGGTPEGHIKIDRFLAAPALFNRKLGGLLALANPPGDYARRDLAAVKKLARLYAIILQRKFAEDRLKENEEKYRTLFENANAAIFLADTATGRILDANRQAELLTGRRRKELIGLNRRLLHPPEEEKYYNEQFRDHVERRTASLADAVVLRKDGARVPVQINSSVLDLGGKKLIHGIFKDVTEFKKTQDELKFTNILLSTQQESSPDGILVVDKKGGILSFNRRFIEMWRIPPDVEASRSDRRALAAVRGMLVDPVAFLKKVQYLYGHPEQKSRDEIALKDGRTFDRYSAAMRAAGGAYLGRVWFFRDITEIKRAEAELRGSEERYRRIIETTHEGYGAIDLNGTITAVNPRMEELFGYAGGEMLGLNVISGLVPPQDRPGMIRQLRTRRRGEAAAYEQRFHRKDGSVFWANVSATPVGDGKRTTGSFAMLSDITARKTAEEALSKLTRCFLEFAPDPDANIGRITRAAGEILGASCVLYNRLEGGLLFTVSDWQAPPDMLRRDKPAGHICLDVISGGKNDCLVIRDLQSSSFAETDPNVRKYGLRTYIGCPVACDGKRIGSLCAVFLADKDPSPNELEIMAILAKALGIEEQRRLAGKTLRENEETLRKIFDTAKDAIFLKGADGRHIKVNRACAELFRLTPEEMVGRTNDDIFSKEDAERSDRTDREILETGKTLNYELTRALGGREYFLNVVKTPLRDAGGKITGILGIVRDITEQKKLEAGLVHRKAVEAVSSVAHDYNNILGAISGYATLILENLSEKSPARPEILQIVKAVERAASVPGKYTSPGVKPDNNN